eukprot:scaffold40041_cov33-Tisochrysis_lutea.AAC.2
MADVRGGTGQSTSSSRVHSLYAMCVSSTRARARAPCTHPVLAWHQSASPHASRAPCRAGAEARSRASRPGCKYVCSASTCRRTARKEMSGVLTRPRATASRSSACGPEAYHEPDSEVRRARSDGVEPGKHPLCRVHLARRKGGAEEGTTVAAFLHQLGHVLERYGVEPVDGIDLTVGVGVDPLEHLGCLLHRDAVEELRPLACKDLSGNLSGTLAVESAKEVAHCDNTVGDALEQLGIA